MLEEIESSKIFGGQQKRYQHQSTTLGCQMTFSVYLPARSESKKLPAIYWLSGLTCNDQNFVIKAGGQRLANELGIIIITPDTSPRGDDVADDEAWDFAQGAGFYLNATQEPWSNHYKMYDYITKEMPTVINESQPVDPERISIMGHSMGGHGALTIALKNPGMYKSVSAFAPICSPTRCPWGEKALSQYLGDDRQVWEAYDASLLIANAQEKLPILVDQGTADNFLVEQLKPELLQQACESNNHPLTLRMQEGYDHSYNFIATFIEDHFKHHAKALF